MKTLKLNKDEAEIILAYRDLMKDEDQIGSLFEDISKEIEYDSGLVLELRIRRL